jgi:hypothetical protein
MCLSSNFHFQRAAPGLEIAALIETSNPRAKVA